MIKAQLFISCPKKTNQLQFILGIFEIFKVKIGISPTIMTEILKFCDNATHNVRNDQVLECRRNRTTNFGAESTSTLGPKIWAFKTINVTQQFQTKHLKLEPKQLSLSTV